MGRVAHASHRRVKDGLEPLIKFRSRESRIGDRDQGKAMSSVET